MPKLKILIADDHDVVRAGVRSLLTTDNWEVCAEANNGRSAVEIAQRMLPDVAIVDIGMPELNGLEVTRQITQLVPDTRVIVLTMNDSEQMARDVFKAGAKGYVLKSDAGQELVTAVSAVLSNRYFFGSKISELVLQTFLEKSPVPWLVDRTLTPREREVLQLLAEGKSSKQIADRLGTSAATVDTQRANIMRKLDLHSIAELVRYAIREHIAEP